MSNMSYCRFGNTLSDLRDCFYALEEDRLTKLSGSEKRAAEQLIALCQQIVEMVEEEEIAEHPIKLKDYTVQPAPTFFLPDDKDRKSLVVGQHAKLTFAIDGHGKIDEERMWVRVQRVISEGEYQGVLDNTPLFASDLYYGQEVKFTWNNVIQILRYSKCN